MMKDFIFFTKESWAYLGCKSGKGRWKARWVFLTGFLNAYTTYIVLKEAQENMVIRYYIDKDGQWVDLESFNK